MSAKFLFPGRVYRAVFLSLVAGAGVLPAGAATMVAQWNFDDAGTAGGSISNVGGFAGTFTGAGGRSAGGGGVSGTAGDYALDPRQVGNTADGAMTSHTAPFLTALNGATGTQQFSISYWQFLESMPASTSFWGNSPSAIGIGGQRGLNAHTPWVDGNLYFDTAGCCDGTTRISGPLGAAIGEWQHITLVYSAGNRQAYLNNTLIASGGGGVALATDFNAFFIGNDNVSALGMDARLDNFTIWNGALTPAEIAVLSVRPVVPEPSAWVLSVVMGAGVLGRRRRVVRE